MASYQLNTIYRAVQGEGFWSGMPVTLVRLQGCNLRCSFCDTPETWDPKGGESIPLPELARRVKKIHRKGDIILITGGEPALQPLTPLVAALCLSGPVHLETNGTLAIAPTTFFSWITVSPKPQAPLDPTTLGRADEIKWLIGGEGDVAVLQDFLEHEQKKWLDRKWICLQPISQNPEATEIAYQACLKHGYRLSLQLHKYIEKE